jgi:hypothetical protein
MNSQIIGLRAGLILNLLFSTGVAFAQSGAGGNHPVKDFLPKSVVKELGATLAPEASINDARATFTLNTDAGPETVTGTVSMLERVNELRAVKTLDAMKKSDVYLDAVKNSAKAPVRYGKALVDAPVDTVKDTARGLGGFLADIGHSIVSDDPSEDNVAKTGLGQSAAKRAFAFELGVNPYSHYEPLQEALSEVAWTAVGGGLTVGATFRAVQNTPGQVLTVSRVANTGRELVRDKSPRELTNRNEESLKAMGVGEALTEAMLNNFNFDPETETRLIVALEAMNGVQGRADLVARATLASSRARAREMRDWTELLAAYHEKVTPAKKVVVIANSVFLIDSRNVAHGVLPTDYIVPTPGLEAVLARVTDAVKAENYKLGSITVTGAIHPQAVKLLKSNGWGTVEAHAGKTLRAP